jgi:hypothetical protein
MALEEVADATLGNVPNPDLAVFGAGGEVEAGGGEAEGSDVEVTAGRGLVQEDADKRVRRWEERQECRLLEGVRRERGAGSSE